MSKGSRQRPTDQKKFSEGYERIFGKKLSRRREKAVEAYFKVSQELEELMKKDQDESI
jgi:hypothetical protein